MDREFRKNGVSYVTVPPRLTRYLRSMLAREKGAFRWILSCLCGLLEKLALVCALGRWPLMSPGYARRLEAEAERICREGSVDCLIPVYTQLEALAAAKSLKNRHPELRYVPWFLDSLSGGYGLRVFTPEQNRNRGLAWERKLLDTADAVLVMESSRRHHETYSAGESYYGRLRYFDLPLLRRRVPGPETPLMGSGCRKLVYVGTLPRGIRSPEYLLAVLRHLDAGYHLWFIGDRDCAVLNAAARTEPRIHVMGPVDHHTALGYEAQADILVNLGSRNPSMTPSKIFEYMSFGKPILSLSASPADPCREYLCRYPLALNLEEGEDPALSAARLTEFAEKTAGACVAEALIRSRFSRNTPEDLCAFLEKLGQEVAL